MLAPMADTPSGEPQTIGLWIEGVGFPIALLIMAAAAIVLAGQVIFWLKSGQWLQIPFGLIPAYAGLEPNSIRWLGVRRVVLSLYETPMAFGLLLFGMGLALAAAKISEVFDAKSKR